MNIRPVNGNSTRSANQRRHGRIYEKDRQLRIKLGRREGRTSNWSQGGFLANGLDDYDLGDQVEGMIGGPGRGRSGFTGKVLRVLDDGQRAVQLVSFDSAALLALQGADQPNASNQAGSSADRESDGSNPNS